MLWVIISIWSFGSIEKAKNTTHKRRIAAFTPGGGAPKPVRALSRPQGRTPRKPQQQPGLLLPKMLRTREKWYVTDAGIINMLNYKDDTLLSEGTYLGYLVETIVFNEISTFAEMQNYKLAYWRDKSKSEVDIVLDMQKHFILTILTIVRHNSHV